MAQIHQTAESVTPAGEPVSSNPRILQVWKRFDLGFGWDVSFLSDGSATFFNTHTSKRLDLPKYSIEILRKAIIRSHAEENAA